MLSSYALARLSWLVALLLPKSDQMKQSIGPSVFRMHTIWKVIHELARKAE